MVRLGAVNADEHRSLGGQYGVKGFPTIKIFGSNKNSPSDYKGEESNEGRDDHFTHHFFFYEGGRTADAIVQEALSTARVVANDRLGGKKTGSGGGRPSGGGGGGGSTKDVVELTDSNFEEMVINSDDYWLVEFFAPWYVTDMTLSYMLPVMCIVHVTCTTCRL